MCSAAARHALTRLSDNLTSHPLSQALFGLLASTWERQYEAVYLRAENLINQCAQSDFLGPDFLQLLARMVSVFVGEWIIL